MSQSTRTLHVLASAPKGGDGSSEHPFTTINQAAQIAAPGDTVLVHEGTYRESVNPVRGGYDTYQRITYAVAPGEHAIIKGSEVVSGWQKTEYPHVWRVEVPNSLFGTSNPYATVLKGDWLEQPSTWHLHTGNVYLNGVSMFEAPDVEAVARAEKREKGIGPGWAWGMEPIARPEETVYQWHAEVGDDTTTIYANFQGYDPNEELTEINVRQTCFYPERTGLNYITVRGFEMAQAATPWAPPTGNQISLMGPHWAKGWIIEDNDIHDSRCSAISLGKDASTGENESSWWGRKPGYQTQLETVFRAVRAGWKMETVGSHVVRNNKLHDCGQNGVVGHLGAIHSVIENNDIYNIADRHEFFGHEIAGIKLHAAIDVTIRNNRFHNSLLGIWLDWQAQGTRVTSNTFFENNRDLMIEVTSGPCLIDNNIFASEYNIDNVAQGTAFVHNLFMGMLRNVTCTNRSTPYHMPHSTEVAGYACVYGCDDRAYQNIYVGGSVLHPQEMTRGTDNYNGCPTSEEEYVQKVHAQGIGDLELFENIRQPAYVDGNVYVNGAQHFDREEHFAEGSSQLSISHDADGSVWLNLTMPDSAFTVPTEVLDTEKLGTPRLVWQRYENPDGTELTLDKDLLGAQRGSHPVPGPLESLEPGHNRIRLA